MMSAVDTRQETHFHISSQPVSCALILYLCILVLLPFISSPLSPLSFRLVSNQLFIMQGTQAESLSGICIPPPLFFVSITLRLPLHHAPPLRRTAEVALANVWK